ncbi:MAG: delta-60 repeat domain-containing protein [Verrucomicrobia bacterium]|nr:delta-60 repeat domain-containing protein [Verrucomicrobiota bacterium]
MRALFCVWLFLFAACLPAAAEVDGALDPTFAPTLRRLGPPQQILAAPDGRLLVTGEFTHLHGRPAAGGAWLTAGGEFLSEFRREAAATRDVPVAIYPDGKVLAIREGTTLAANRLVRLLATGETDATFQCAEEGVLRALILPDGRVLARFVRNVAGSRIEFLRLRADGSVDPSFVPPTPAPFFGFHAFVRLPDGRILARGTTALRRTFYRLQPDGALDLSFQYTGPDVDPFLANSYRDELLVAPDSRIYAYYVKRSNDLGAGPPARRLQKDGALDPTFLPQADLGDVTSALALPDGGLLLCLGGISPAILSLRADGSGNLGFGSFGRLGLAPRINVFPQLLSRPGGAVLAGDFELVGRRPRTGLAAIDLAGQVDPNFATGSGAERGGASVTAVATAPAGQLWIAGDFTSIDDVPRRGLARLQADGRPDPAFTAGLQADVSTGPLAEDGAGGVYAKLALWLDSDARPSQPARALCDGLVHFLPDGSLDGGFVPPAELAASVFRRFGGIEQVLRQPDGRLLVRARFDLGGGNLATRVVRLRADGAREAGFELPGDGLLALAPSGRLHVGPLAFRPDGSPDVDFAADTSAIRWPRVRALTVDAAGRLLVAQAHDPTEVPPAASLHRLQLNGALDSTFRTFRAPFGEGLFRTFRALMLQPDGRILAGGAFLSYAGREVNSLLRLTADGLLDTSFSAGSGPYEGLPRLLEGREDIAGQLRQPDGRIIVHGSFQTFQGQPRSGVARLLVAPAAPAPSGLVGRLVNVSTRAQVGLGDQIMIGGFVLQGTGTRRVAIRALGPSLTALRVPDALANPSLRLVDAAGVTVLENDDWLDSGAAETVAAAGLTPGDARESALVATLGPGAYTALVRGVGGTTGVALVEIYDLDPPGPLRLVNLSTRAVTDSLSLRPSTGPTIAGFAVRGGRAKLVLRGISRGLAAFGISGPPGYVQGPLMLANGDLLLPDFQQALTGFSASDLAATGLTPADSADRAVLLELPEGNYTLILEQPFQRGVAVAEIYEVPTSAARPPLR